MVTWLALIGAIAVEVVATTTLPRTEGFSRPGWTALVLFGYATSFWLLAVAIREIPVSVAYAVWSGVGTAGIAVIGALFLEEPLTVVKAAALVMIIGGVVLLNLHGAH